MHVFWWTQSFRCKCGTPMHALVECSPATDQTLPVICEECGAIVVRVLALKLWTGVTPTQAKTKRLDEMRQAGLEDRGPL